MMDDSIDLESVDGYDLRAEMYDDEDSSPFEADCYSPEDISQWRNDDWKYVVIVVTASRQGIDLGSDSICSMECGRSGDRYINPLRDDTGDEFAYGYGPGLITGAVADAKAALAAINAAD